METQEDRAHQLEQVLMERLRAVREAAAVLEAANSLRRDDQAKLAMYHRHMERLQTQIHQLHGRVDAGR